MDLLQLAAQLFTKQLGGAGNNLNASAVQDALGSLLGGGKGGGIDLGAIVSQLDGGGLASLAKSWLGDGGNDAISPGQVLDIFGQSKVEGFASQLGLDKDTAASGLSGMLPDLVDQSSKGGSLLDMVGGAGGLLGAASKFLK